MLLRYFKFHPDIPSLYPKFNHSKFQHTPSYNKYTILIYKILPKKNYPNFPLPFRLPKFVCNLFRYQPPVGIRLIYKHIYTNKKIQLNLKYQLKIYKKTYLNIKKKKMY